MRKIYALLVFMLSLAVIKTNGQASNYTLVTSSGASLETIISPTSVTTVTSGSADDGFVAVTPGGGFSFDYVGVNYTSFAVGTNGYLIFGSSTPGATIPASLATQTGFPGVFVFGRDGNLNVTNGGAIVHGAAAGGKYVFQHTNYSGGSVGGESATSMLTYQIVLWGPSSATPGKIEVIYGTSIGTPATAGTAGLRDIANTYRNAVDNSTSSTATFPTSAWPASGSLYTYTPPPPCVTPADQATGFTTGATTFSSIAYSFTAAVSAPSGYLVVRYPAASPVTNPVNGTSYTAGAALGAGTVVAVGTAVSGTATGLVASASYDFYVYTYNSTLCSGGPLYNTSSPLSGAGSTPAGTLSGIKTVGTGGDYNNLTSAFTAINTSGLSGNIELQLTTGYPAAAETYPIATCSTSAQGGFSVKIYPTVSGLSISSSNTTGTFQFNNASNITIDGRVNQTGTTKDLVITNTNLGTSYAIQFINDAVNNTVQYCTISSRNSSASSGTIVFGTGTVTGNDNNTITNNDIREGTTTPNNAIYAAGSTGSTALNNSGNTISNNNIFNFFSATTASTGVLISSGNTDWTISGNSLYQTASRTATTGNTHNGISISNTSGNNFVISGNFIGGTAASAGGTAWTVGGSVANRFIGINLSVGATTASSVQGNTIANFNWSSSSGATTLPGIWAGIYLSSGIANIGTVTGNTIGSGTGTGSVLITTSTSGVSVGIGSVSTSTGNVTIANNIIGSINVAGSTASISHSFNGIWNTSSITGKYTVSNNTIGSAGTANSIRYITAGTGTTAAVITGIRQAASPTQGAVITGNTIVNLSSAYVPSSANSSNHIAGIIATSGIDSISGNTVRDISVASNATGTGSTSSVLGISLTSSTSGALIRGNQVYNLSNTHASGTSSVTGINVANATSGRNNIERNLVYALTVSSTSASAQIRGISLTSGLDTIKNNMVRLGTNIANGNEVYGIYDGLSTSNSAIIFNSVYIGGTGVGTQTGNSFAFRSLQTTNTRTYRNNIFVNARSNASTGGKHYAVGVAGTFPNAAGLVLNNNVYQATGTGSVFGLAGAADVTSFANWKTTTGADASSYDNDPQFVAPTAVTPDLHINTTNPTVAEGTGFNIAAVTDDYDGQDRSGLTPVDIGADAFNGSSPVPVISLNSLTPGTTPQCVATARNVSVNVTTPAGTITGVTITYNNGTLNSNVAMTNTSGNTWEFTIPAASPGNTSVSWSISATNSLNITAVFNGTNYADEPLTNVSVNVTAAPSSLCLGSSALLSATLPGSTTIGSGSVSEFSGSIFRHGFGNGDYRHQLLYTAAELSAAGIPAGNLSSIGFNVTSLGSTGYTNYTISLANVPASALTSSFLTNSLTQVYLNPTFTLASGLNTFNFGTGAGSASAFSWDGTSNILVNICYTVSGASSSSNVASTTTAFTGNVQLLGSAGACTASTGSTFANRPNATFTFNALAPYSIQWLDGTTQLATTDTVTVTPAATTNYTFRITQLVGGCEKDFTTPVTVNPVPAAPGTGSFPSAQCGNGVPNAFVTGASNGQYRWYLTPTGGSPIAGELNDQLTTFSISTTTDFYVAIFDGTCESPRTQVTANVAIPDSVFAVATPAAVCLGSSLDLSFTQNGSNNTYTVTWTATPAAGSGIPTSESGSPVTITPTAVGTYTYLLSAVDGACTANDTVQVQVSALPVITGVVASPDTICIGGSVQLSATTNSFSTGTAEIGTGTLLTGSTTQPTAFCNRWPSFRMQLLYTAAELTAAGAVAGNLTDMAFNINSLGDAATNDNFRVKIGHTNLTAFTGWVDTTTGFTTVYTPKTYTHTASGWQTIPFDAPFNWDGVSNIVVQVVHLGADLTNNSQTYYTTSSGNRVVHSNSSGEATASPTLSTQLLNIRFGATLGTVGPNLSYVWDNGGGTGNPVTVSPLVTTTYTVTGTDAVGCADTAQVEVVVNQLPEAPIGTNAQQCGTGVPTVSVVTGGVNGSGVFNWYLTPTGGSPLPGENGSTLSAYSISTPTSFYVSEIGTNGCESERTQVDVTFDLIPDVLELIPSSYAVCVGEPISFTVNQTGGSNTYLFSYTASPVAGSGINSPAVEGVDSSLTNGNITITPTAAGTITYTITGFDPDKGCFESDTAVVLINALPVITAVTANPDTICAGASVQLSATNNIISAGQGTIGTGVLVTSQTSQPTAFCNRWSSYRMQIIYTAAQLQAAGLSAGNITAMAFNISTLGSAATNANFRVKMSHTALNNFATAAWVDTTTGFTDVYTPKTYTHTASGWQTIPFDAPFVWDGTSNIIVQVAHLGANSSNNSSTFYTTSATNQLAHSNTGGQNTATPTLSTTLLHIRFNGQVSQAPAGTYSWLWDNGAGSGSNVTVTPSTTTSYTVELTNTGTGCKDTSDAVEVVVNPLPAAPISGGDISRCGPGAVILSATGTGGTLNWYNVPVAGTSLGTGNTYNPTVTANTQFWVAETSAEGCEGPRTVVNVTLTTPPNLQITAGGATTFCAGGSVSLDAAAASDPSYVNFSWSPATGLSATNTAVVTANPSTTTTYVVTANDGSPSGCVNTDTIVITVNPLPVISSVTAVPATICNGASVTLSAQAGFAGNPVMGTGTLTSTTVTPYKGFFGGSKIQMMYTAAELTAAGLVAGSPINTVGFDVTSFTSPYTFNGFTIAMKNTTTANLSTALETGLTTVLPAASFTLTGTAPFTVSHTLASPFTWDGTSNLVIEFCFNNADGGGVSGNSATIRYTTTTSSLTRYFSADNNLNVCSAPGSGTSTTTRPNLRLSFATDQNSNYSWAWTNGGGNTNPSTVTPTVNTSYTVTATNLVTGCQKTADTVVNVTVKNLTANASAVNPSICIGGSTLLRANADGGQPLSFAWVLQGDNVILGTDSTLSVSPVTTTTYTVTVTDPCNNSVSSDVTVTVNGLPSVTVTPAAASICQPGATAVGLSAAGASTYAWTPAAGLNSTNDADVTALPANTTTYIVTGTDANGCTDTAQVLITVNPAVISLSATASPAPACEGSAVTLRAPSTQYGPAGSYQFSVSSGAALDPMTGATIIVSDSTDDAPMNTSQGVNTTAGASVPIGFDFNFNGSNYTHFGTTPDGFMALSNSTAAITSQFTNTVTSTTNIPKLYPYWDDMATGGLGQGGYVRYVLNGTAPNRILVVEWYVTIPRAVGGAPNSTFQAWLYETSNKIEFRYGAMASAAMSASVGITGSSTQYRSVTISSGTSSNSSSNNSNAGQPASGTMYTFELPKVSNITWMPGNLSGDSVVVTPPVGTTTYTVTANTGSCQASATVDVTVNAKTLITADITTLSQFLAQNTPSTPLSVTATGTGTLGYQWYSNTSNSATGGTSVGSGNGGDSPTFTPPTSSIGTTYYYAVVTGDCGSDTSSVAVVEVVDANVNLWTGAGGSNWSTPGSWSLNQVPTAFNDAVIPTGATPYPVLSAASTAKNLEIQSGATVSLNGQTLNIVQGVSGAGSFIGSQSSNLSVGANSTLRFATGGSASYIRNLTINAGTSTLASALDVTGGTAPDTYGTVTVANGASLVSNGNLTFKSNANGTARLAQGATSGQWVVGDVTVERYIPWNGQRAWRFLSVPTKGAQTIAQAWQERNVPNVANPFPGYGTIITSPITNRIAQGFDTYSAKASMQSWSTGTNNWLDVTTTNNATTGRIETLRGYAIYIRGDRSIPVSGATNTGNATTLRTKGTLYTGNQAPVSVAANQFALIGNTYVSPVDITLMTRTGVTNAYYVWDPKLLTTGGSLGGYVTFSGTNDWEPSIPAGASGGSYSGPNTVIQTGQAFMVQATGAGGSITLTESSKVAGSAANGFRPAAPASGGTKKLRARLYTNSSTPVMADANVTVFDQLYANAVDGDDAIKLANGGENLAILRDGYNLVVEGRQPVSENDTTYFAMWNMRQQIPYKLEIVTENMSIPGLSAVLVDNFNNTSTPLDLVAGTTQYNFLVTAATASSARDRFKIIYRQVQPAPVPVTFVSISANKVGTNVKVDWKVAEERNIRQYEVERSGDGRNFNAIGTVTATGTTAREKSYSWLDATPLSGKNYYRIKSLGAAGDVKYTYIVLVSGGDIKPAFTIAPNPVEGSVVSLQFKNQPQGRYNIRLMANTGESIMQVVAEHAGGNSTQLINLPATIARGIYQVEIIGPEKVREVQQLFINTLK